MSAELNAESVVWVVFKTYRIDDLIDSVWTTKEAAQAHADRITRTEGRDTFVEDYPLLIDGSGCG